MVARLVRQPLLVTVELSPFVPGVDGYYRYETKVISTGSGGSTVPEGMSEDETLAYLLDQADTLVTDYTSGEGVAILGYSVYDGKVYDTTGYRLGSEGEWASSVGGSSSVVTRRVWVPGVPATPGVYQHDYIGASGWDGGGVSLGTLAGDGRFEFRLSTQAAMAGLTPPTAQYAYAGVAYGWLRNGDTLQVVESGAVRYTAAPGTTPDALLAVRRAAGAVDYLIDDAVVYTSASASYDELLAMGMPYGVSEYVDAVTLEATATAVELVASTPSAVASLDSYAGPWLALGTALPALTGQLTVPYHFELAASLPAIEGRLYGEGGGAELATALPLPTARLSGEPLMQYNYLLAATPPLQPNFIFGPASYPVELATATPAAAGLLSGHAAYGELRAELPGGWQGRFNGFAVVDKFMRELVRSEDWALLDTDLILVLAPSRMELGDSADLTSYPALFALDSLDVGDAGSLTLIQTLLSIDGLDVGSVAALTRTLYLAALDALYLEDRGSAGSVVDLSTTERVVVNSALALATREALQYAVNLDNGSLTTYRGFDFHGFASVGDTAFGWRPDGLYRIGGQHHTPVEAFIDFGVTDFGGAEIKHVQTAWLGIRTDAELYLRLRADDGTEKVYRLLDTRGTRKALLAKGVTGRLWGMKLELADATFATLDSVEIEVNKTTRRIGGRRH